MLHAGLSLSENLRASFNFGFSKKTGKEFRHRLLHRENGPKTEYVGVSVMLSKTLCGVFCGFPARSGVGSLACQPFKQHLVLGQAVR